MQTTEVLTFKKDKNKAKSKKKTKEESEATRREI